MILNHHGLLVHENWKKLIDKFNIRLDEFVVMPNHIHGIIIIKSNHGTGLINQTPTLGLMIRYFKSKCTYIIHKNGFNNDVFQRNYYERIIRDEEEYLKIKEYIQLNPTMYDTDENNVGFDLSNPIVGA